MCRKVVFPKQFAVGVLCCPPVVLFLSSGCPVVVLLLLLSSGRARETCPPLVILLSYPVSSCYPPAVLFVSSGPARAPCVLFLFSWCPPAVFAPRLRTLCPSLVRHSASVGARRLTPLYTRCLPSIGIWGARCPPTVL